MRYKTVVTLLIISAVALSLVGCGVPKTEHEKVVKELEQVKQETTTLSDQLGKVTKEKEALSQQIGQLQNQISTLRKENEELKAKLAPKKPAKKAPAKKK